jgi:putative FmdB family regulatory protein
MPVYIYRCKECGVQFDKLQSFKDDPLVRCPECGKKALTKVYQPVGIVFKGSGFYATDHHSPSGQSQKKSEEAKESSENKEPVTPVKSDKSEKTEKSEKSAETKE